MRHPLNPCPRCGNDADKADIGHAKKAGVWLKQELWHCSTCKRFAHEFEDPSFVPRANPAGIPAGQQVALGGLIMPRLDDVILGKDKKRERNDGREKESAGSSA